MSKMNVEDEYRGPAPSTFVFNGPRHSSLASGIFSNFFWKSGTGFFLHFTATLGNVGSFKAILERGNVGSFEAILERGNVGSFEAILERGTLALFHFFD